MAFGGLQILRTALKGNGDKRGEIGRKKKEV
jgi:hypothetical protein